MVGLVMSVIVMSFLGGVFILWKGVYFDVDRAWKNHYDQSVSNGLFPQRNEYWERDIKRKRMSIIIVGILFLVMGIIGVSVVIAN